MAAPEAAELVACPLTRSLCGTSHHMSLNYDVPEQGFSHARSNLHSRYRPVSQ